MNLSSSHNRRRLSPRWRNRLGSWVGSYGTTRLIATLTKAGLPVTRSSVSHWVAGRTVPRLAIVQKIVSLSRGRVTLRDFNRQSPSNRGGHGSQYQGAPSR